MRNFQDTLETRKRSFISAFSIYMTVPLRVFDPNACRYLNKSLQKCHIINENEKKRGYIERVIQVDHATFTPLVFSIYRNMGRECLKIFSRLSDLSLEKRNIPKSVVTNWVILVKFVSRC